MLNALDLAKSVIALHNEIQRLGGAERVPDLWAKYSRFRALLLKSFGLLDITENHKLVIPPTVPKTEERRMQFLRQECRYYIRGLKKLLEQIGINQNFDQITSDEALVWQASYVCMRLYEKEMSADISPVRSRKTVLESSKRDKIPVNDILVTLHIEDAPYPKFLIEIVFYGGYADAEDVLADLDKIREPVLQWMFLLYNSDAPDERELGQASLMESDLKFVRDFLWWESNLGFFNEGEPSNPDDQKSKSSEDERHR